jgi:hypothetical protein
MAPTPIGARRRITALMYNGWSPAALSAASGLPEAVFTYQPDSLARARTGTLERVAGLYERLWKAPPPRRTEAEQAEADQAADHGRRVGFAPPMAYDDDLIDLPEGRADPKVWRRNPRGQWSRGETLEDIRFLREVDGAYARASPAELAMRLGKSRDSVEQALVRQRRAQRSAEQEQELEAG